jgi:hypothetical protein
MKMRNGFVSNSSTSSFFMLYRRATEEELNDPNIVVSIEGGEGEIFFHPSPEIAEYIKTHDIEGGYGIYYSYFDVRDGENEIDKSELMAKIAAIPDGDVKYMVRDVDQWEPESLEDLKEVLNIDEEDDE